MTKALKRFKRYMMKQAGRLVKAVVLCLYVLLAGYTTLLTGCVGMMPTRVPPLTEEMNYKVMNYKGWTFVGLNESAYNWNAEKLNFWRVSMDFVNKPAIALHDQAVNWLNIGLSAGLFGGAPAAVALALKKVPKGAVSKEEHQSAVNKAGNLHPDEFNGNNKT